MSTPTEPNSAGAIDVAAWRERIRSDTLSNYHFVMGRSFRRLGDTEQAIQAFRRAIDANPEHALAYGLLADCLRAARRPEADDIHRTALSLEPRYAAAAAAIDLADQASHLQHQDPGGALALLERAYALDSARDARSMVADVLLQIADLLTQSDSTTALLALEKGALMFPDNPGILAQLGRAYDVAERWDEAIHCFEASLKIEPGQMSLLFRLATTLNEACRFEETITIDRHAPTLPPSEIASLHLYQAMALIGLNRGGEAVRLLQSSPSQSTSALATLGLAHLAAGEIDQAEGTLTRAMKIEAQHPAVLGWLGLTQQRKGHFEQALDLHNRAIKAAPSLIMSRFDRALTLEAMNRRTEALEEHRHVLSHVRRGLEYYIRTRPWAAAETLRTYQNLGLALMR